MTPPNRPLPAVVSDAHRDAVAQALSAHFANDRITVETLDARMAMVYEATTMPELEAALAGLDLSPRSETDPGHPVLIASPETVPMRSVAMAVLGGFEAKGSWVVPRELQVTAILGGGELDMREARFAPGITEINITALLGGVQITVPPGVRVEVLGSAMMGGFAQSGTDETAFDPSAPVLRIRGIAIMGGVDVRMRGPSKKMLKRFEEAMARARLGRGKHPTPRP
jgi:hypothetical protein